MKKNRVLLASFVAAAVVATTVAPLHAAGPYSPGVTIEDNANPSYDADYQATFVYEDKDAKDATSVTVAGNFQFYDQNDPVVKNYYNTGDGTGAHVYNAYDYKDGMFNTGYGLNNDQQSYTMVETSEERFEVTIPLPGNEYYYDYTVTYSDGSSKTIQDPVNPSPKNDSNGHDSGHSLFYVGNSSNTTAGQEEIYARTDGKTGSYSFVTYTATDGTTQPLGVYLPKNYSSDKTYPTLYVSHGGGGNEAEWMAIGDIPNIMDNLMAKNEMSEAVVVTMDNTYFGWNYETIAKNFKENIIPYVEKNYAVSKDVKNRALCGLSMGSMTTTTIMLSHSELFDRYGCFSGANTNATINDLNDLKTKTIYLTAGSVDMALMGTNYGTPTDNKTRGLMTRLTNEGVSYGSDIKNGAHDWGVWRAALTTFAKDYLWDAKDLTDVTPGVHPGTNTNSAYDGDYQATFVYKDSDPRDAVKVTVSGNLQFYSKDDPVVKAYPEKADPVGAKVYDAFGYKDGMFNTGYGLNSDSVSYDLKETKEERFEVTLPLPGNQYYYDYTITYKDGSTVTIQDPANPSPKNVGNGHDSGHSLFYLGSKDNTTPGQEYIYPASADKKGTFQYVTYTATDGTNQPLGVYLPKGYDPAKTYKTLYVSHGGGGNEAEWNGIGSLSNIMDNLIADGEVEETIVVTMDNTYFGWDYDKIAKNFKENIIPFMENNYHSSKKVDDRALCGLSMGALTTGTIMFEHTDMFQYYACFSGTGDPKACKDIDLLKTRTIYLTGGNVDMAIQAPVGSPDSAFNRGKTVRADEYLTSIGVEHGYDLKDGAHDWGVWRSTLTTFVKDYLWTKDKDNGSQTNNGSDGSVTTTTKKPVSTTSVRTGDDLELGSLFSLLLASILSFIIIKRNKKKMG